MKHTPSPPPHIIGQLVEMGFGPTEVRAALARTKGGTNVQAAAEALLVSAIESNREFPAPADAPPRRRVPTSDRPQAQIANGSVRDRERERELDRDRELTAADHADRLLSTASEIGAGLIGKAGAFFAQSRERVQKAYEEQRAKAGSGTSTPGDARPRWMVNAELAQAEQEKRGSESRRKEAKGFRDDHDLDRGEVLSPRPGKPAVAEAQKASAPASGDFLSADAPPAFYVSPFRRGRSKVPFPTPAAASTSITPPRPSTPTIRAAVPVSSAALASAEQYKAKGTAAFKLGAYADAEAAYSQAISALPTNHLLLVLLFNNRALARLRTGDSHGAEADASSSLSLIGPFDPTREHSMQQGVDLGEGALKAWKRRAEALEAREKWEEAGKDWERVSGARWAGGKIRGEAASAAGRCRRLANQATQQPQDQVAAAPKPKPRPMTRPKPKPAQAVVVSGEALSAVRAAHSAAEAEDTEKHALKDKVDAKLLAWKGGKEANLRALIASLENVLWDGCGWKSVGMAELISPGQVKVKYMKAIAKVHPDKVRGLSSVVDMGVALRNFLVE